ncbi:MAG TPA: cytochrome c maturation protein CcmE [Gemmatimonadaceae bacterium]|nr:cytochrome c maturation protein CcmE [Gemmatimonadaceae bacterium]
MTRARKGRRLTFIALGAVILGAFGYLLYGGIGENLVYFLTPAELLAKGTGAVDTPVRLGGMVAENSVVWNADKLDLRFRITDGNKEIPVRSTGAPPSMFRPGMGVIVEGRFGKDGVFSATNLMVRHSNEYHPPKEGEMPKEMYQQLIKEGKS